MQRYILILISCAVVLEFLSLRAKAQSPAAESLGGVHDKLVNQGKYLIGKGYNEFFSETIDHLATAERKRFPVQLTNGTAYAFVGSCGANCNHVEISLYDNKGTQLRRSPENQDTVTLGGYASYSGSYDVEIAVPGCHMAQCEIGLMILRHEAPAAAESGGKVQPPANETQAPSNALYKVVNVAAHDVLKIRSGPKADLPVVGTIPHNARGIRLVGSCTGQWCHINYGGNQGWVNRLFLEVQDHSQASIHPAIQAHGAIEINGAGTCGGKIVGSWDVTADTTFPATLIMPSRQLFRWEFKSDGPLGGEAFLHGGELRRYSCQGNLYTLDNFFGITLTLSPNGRRLGGECRDLVSAAGGGCRIHAVRKSGPLSVGPATAE